MELQYPFSPEKLAARVYGVESVDSFRTLPFTPRPDDITIPGQAYAGMTKDDCTSVFYDPTHETSKNPITIPPPGVIETVPGFRHGPAEFEPVDPVDFGPYSLGNTPLMMAAVEMDLRTKPCSCRGLNVDNLLKHYSIGESLFTVANALRIRKMLHDTGLIAPSEALQKSSPKCICAVFGDDEATARGIYELALNYGDQSVIKLLNPAQVISTLNYQFVRTAVEAMRSQINDQLKLQYAIRAGAAASLQPYPECQPLVRNDPIHVEPEFLNLQFNDPRATPAAMKCYAQLTGVRVGQQGPKNL